MGIVYSAIRRFEPSISKDWDKYIAWSGLTQLREVVSLDSILCPTVFRDLTAEDWQHNVQADFQTHLFRDLDYLLGKTAGDRSVNVLALLQNPTDDEIQEFADTRFKFRGFDLLDIEGGNSALTNCGGIDKAFSPNDLSECGLLTDHSHALKIQQSMVAEYPNEHHANCDVWAIWQMTTA